MKADSEIRKMYPGEFFGEQALLYDSPRTASIYAASDLKCLAIAREELKRALGQQLQHIIYKNSIRIAFDRSSVLNSLTNWQAHILTEHMEVKSYNGGESVILAGI